MQSKPRAKVQKLYEQTKKASPFLGISHKKAHFNYVVTPIIINFADKRLCFSEHNYEFV
jgi:hypothetical protein